MSPGRSARSAWTPYALLTPGMLWLAIFFLVPTVMLVKMSLSSGTAFAGDGTFTFDWQFSNYSEAWNQYVIDSPIFQKSLVYALIATVLALVIAYPLAYTIAFKAGRWKNFLLVLVIAPFFTSFLLRTNAWQTILVDYGPVVTFMKDTGMLSVLHADQHAGLLAQRGLSSSLTDSPARTGCSPHRSRSSSVSPTTSCPS